MDFLKEIGNYKILFSDAKVIRCIVDHAFSFVIADQDDFLTVQIEGIFVLSVGEVKHEISPQNATQLGNALNILRKSVIGFDIQEHGQLMVVVDKIQIDVQPHNEYEAWQCWSESGLRIVCMPDGQLAIWKL